MEIATFDRIHWLPNFRRYTALTIAVLSAVYFMIQDVVFRTNLWPYLVQLDPDVSEDFYGYSLAVKNAASAVLSPAFGRWMNERHDAQSPVVFGLVCQLVANLIFFLASHAVGSEKWMIFTSRLISGIGSGCYGVLTAYLSMSTNLHERSAVLGIRSLGATSGWVLGALLLMVFSPLGYTGLFDMYTAPAAVSLLIAASLVIATYFSMSNHWMTFSARGGNVVGVGVNWIAASVNVATRFATLFAYNYMMAAMGPLSMLMFNLTEGETLFYNSFLLFGTAGLSLVQVSIISFYCLKHVNERSIILFGLFFPFISFLVSYAYPGGPLLKTILLTVNETRSCTREWCDTARSISDVQYIIGVFVAALGYEMTCLPTTVLFSKILGTTRQGTMQGLFVSAGELAKIFAPIVFVYAFDWSGLEGAWLFAMVLAGLNVILWVATYRYQMPNEPMSEPLLDPTSTTVCSRTYSTFSDN